MRHDRSHLRQCGHVSVLFDRRKRTSSEAYVGNEVILGQLLHTDREAKVLSKQGAGYKCKLDVDHITLEA